jgi:hypothetical protein
MEDNDKLIESLLEKATDYGKTTFELVKLKTLDKTSDVVSSLVPHGVVFILITTFLIFVNIGLAIWLGDILGRIYFGFFVVAAFYGLTGFIIHFFWHERIKKMVRDNFIKQMLK